MLPNQHQHGISLRLTHSPMNVPCSCTGADELFIYWIVVELYAFKNRTLNGLPSPGRDKESHVNKVRLGADLALLSSY